VSEGEGGAEAEWTLNEKLIGRRGEMTNVLFSRYPVETHYVMTQSLFYLLSFH
jgi:hypothetical protein